MRANRSRDTGPERAVRSILHSRGYRYRTHYKPVAGLRRSADIAFTRYKLAIFIDGCFWHRCPRHFIAPKTNAAYWGPKIDGNVARDRRTDRALRSAGWTVMRFWEHEAPGEIADLVQRQLDQLQEAVQ